MPAAATDSKPGRHGADGTARTAPGPSHVPKGKKGMMRRLKSTLSTTLRRRKSLNAMSPTQGDLTKVEPENATPTVCGGQQDEVKGEAEDEQKVKQNKRHHCSQQDSQESLDSETEINASIGGGEKTETAEVLQFDASLPTVKAIEGGEDEDDQQQDGKMAHREAEMEEKTRSTLSPRNFNKDDVAEEKGGPDEDEVYASHDDGDASEEKGVGRPSVQSKEEKYGGYEDDEEDTLEIFDANGQSEGNQQSAREPEDDDDDELSGRHDLASPFEPSPPVANVELVVIGVSPMALRHRAEAATSVSPRRRIAPLVSSCIPGLEAVTVAVPPASHLHIRTMPVSSPRAPSAPSSRSGSNDVDIHDHTRLQRIREEDANGGSEVELQPVVFQHFHGRRHVITASDAPILASSYAKASPRIHGIEYQGSGMSMSKEGMENERVEKGKEEVDQELSSDHDRDESEDGTTEEDAAAAITNVFGENIAGLLGADPWGDRQDGFDAIQRVVKQTDVSASDSQTRQRLLCASFAAVQCGVEDRVAPVMFCALECLRAVLKEFARVLPDERSAMSNAGATHVAAINTQLSSLIGAIVRKLGDSNKRTQREATQALIRVARVRSLRALPHLLLHLSGREVPARRQLETLRRLVQELGLADSVGASTGQQQLTLEVVLQFVVPSLKIAEEKTRRAAVELLADLQSRTGSPNAWQTQLAHGGAVKPEMLRVISRRVDELLTEQQKQQGDTNVQAGDVAPATGATQGTNQAEEQADDEAAFPPAELVDVPQEDAQASKMLLEMSLQTAQGIVGPVGWRKLSSKTWSDRKEALLDVEKAIGEAKSDLRDARPCFGGVAQGSFVAYSALLHRALGDSIAPVVNCALDAFATLVKVFGPRVEWREADVRDVTLLTLLRLLAAMQRPNTRTTRAACRGVLKLARLPNARHPLRYVLSCIFAREGSGSNSSPCDPQVQMHLLRLLVPEFGFQADGLGASRVLDAVSKGLTHSSARVRRSAADVALSAQRLLGRDFVLARLQGVKPVTLKELEKSFVDGVGGSGGGERPQTVHATAGESSAPATIGATELPPVTFGGLGELSSRRLLSSAPVGIGRLQCTPLYEETTIGADASRGISVLSNEEENLMDAILGVDPSS